MFCLTQYFVRSCVLHVLFLMVSATDSTESCFDSLKGVQKVLIAKPNYNYSIEGNNELGDLTVFEFPGLVKNPLWMFTSLTLTIYNNHPKLNSFYYFETKSEDTACENLESNRNYVRSDNSVTTPASEVSVRPFVRTFVGFKCLTEYRTGDYLLSFNVKKIDKLYLWLFVFSTFLYLVAPQLGRSAKLHYSGGTVIGIFGSLIVLAFLLSRLLPGRKSITGVFLFSGWSLTAYIIKMIYNNVTNLLLTQFWPYLVCYCALMGFVSFAVTFYYGPIRNPRAQTLITWIIKLLSFVGIYYSVQVEEIAFTYMILIISFQYIPLSFKPSQSLTNLMSYFKLKWMLRNPPKRKLLTISQFEKEAEIETQKALEELRQFCMKPESKPWKIVKKLAKPDKMASFVEGESHVSQLEMSLYEDEISRLSLLSSDTDDQSGSESLDDQVLTATTSAANVVSATNRTYDAHKSEEFDVSEDSGNTES